MKQVAKLDTTMLDKITAQLEPRAERIIASTANEVEGIAKDAIQSGSKSGRIYKVGKNKFHQASAPGEAPATDTGNLVNSILAEAFRRLAWRVNVYAEYGVHLELGTHKMSKRPYLVPAVEKVRAKFEKAWGDLFK